MKKAYQAAECKRVALFYEGSLLAGSDNTDTGSSSGSDMDDADYGQDPFSFFD